MDISKLLTFSAKEGASDCHISAGEPPMIRLHGDLKKLDHPPLTAEETHALVYDMMSDAQRKNFEEKRECDFSFELGDIARFRVNVFVQNRGLGAVFRNIPTEIIPMEKLGLPPVVRQLCDKEKGLILVTGPTGSGKSTTLASMVDYLNNTFEGHIITIEDPIEFVHKTKKCLVNQRELGVHTLSFANALKSALREDPDIILVGEMRDLETIQLALTAAETGHLVFGTLHTSSAPKTIDRIIDAFPPAQQAQIRTQLSEALEAVLTQTLLKKSRRTCRRPGNHGCDYGRPESHPRRKAAPDSGDHAGQPEGRHADDGHGLGRIGHARHRDQGRGANAQHDAEPLRRLGVHRRGLTEENR
jgi:twitching motility protein PilT